MYITTLKWVENKITELRNFSVDRFHDSAPRRKVLQRWVTGSKYNFAAAAAAGAVAGKYMPGWHIRGEWRSSEYAWNERKKMLDYSDK